MTAPRPIADIASAYREAPVLVLGATGFLGAWVAHVLARAGARVHAVVRDRRRLAEAVPAVRAIVHEADLTEPGAIAGVLDAARPAVVFNLAGYGVDRRERDPSLMQALNHDLVRTLCDALDERPAIGGGGVPLVHVGSALEYGRVNGRLREDVPPRPTTAYGRTKLAGMTHAAGWSARRDRPVVLARLFNVYGPGEHADRLFPSLLRLAETGGQLDLTSGRQHRDFAWVGDVVEGLLRLADRPAAPGDVVHLGSGHLTTVREFAEAVAAELGLDGRALRFGALPDREEEMWHAGVDVTRLRSLTGWAPATTVAEGVRRSREVSHAG